jgi:hypothetical protein
MFAPTPERDWVDAINGIRQGGRIRKDISFFQEAKYNQY